MIRTIAAHSALTLATVRALRRHYLFATLSDPQWLRLEPQIYLYRLAAGHRMFSQGDPATACFVVCAGSVKLFRSSPQGLEKIMRLIHTGQSFAESVLFSAPPRYPFHAQAVATSVLAAVDREIYLSVLSESFNTFRALMAQMVVRIQAQWDEIEMLSLHGSQIRVSRYLLALQAAGGDCQPGPLRLPSRRVVLAAQLGLAPETVSRALHALRASGAIDVQRGAIDIRDADALRRRAQL